MILYLSFDELGSCIKRHSFNALQSYQKLRQCRAIGKARASSSIMSPALATRSPTEEGKQ